MTVEIRRIGPADAAVLDRVAEDVFDEDIDGELLAAYLVGADLPAYAPELALSRYQDPAYLARMEAMTSGQL